MKRGDPAALAYEAAGLDWLRAAAPPELSLPAVVELDGDRLITARISPGSWDADADVSFGRGLASLHDAGAPAFGWADREQGFIGPLPQSNEPAADWPSFYAARRVLAFVGPAVDSGAMTRAQAGLVERVCDRMAELAGPAEPPARIHGDLWRGNVLADTSGRVWLIDPAAHGGHRETDLAMMRLFGGFGERCYDAYADSFPLADGWRDRIGLHQLHPLLVHAVLFGAGYGAHAAEVARRYC